MKNFSQSQFGYWQDGSHNDRRHPAHPVIEAYVVPKLNFINEIIGLNKTHKVLDVGAGNGYFSYYFNEISDVTAIDYSEIMLKNNPATKKIVMDARDLKFADNSFDLVFCHALLHHIDNEEREGVIEEMKRVSKKYVVVIEPNRNNPLMAAFGLLKKEEGGLLDFSIGYLRSLVGLVGLKIIKYSSFGLLTPNRMPIPLFLLKLEKSLFERPMRGGISNIIIATK